MHSCHGGSRRTAPAGLASGRTGSDQSAYSSTKYSNLDAYVDDLLEVCAELNLQDVALVGHSVGAMMAVGAAARGDGHRFSRLVLLTASPVYMNTPGAPEMDHEIQGSFGRINPRVARDFARVAFLSDVRHLLRDVTVPVLVLQSTHDVVTPEHVGTYLHHELPNSTLVRLAATGHFPQSSAPEETSAAILEYLKQR
ncbi:MULTISPECIES: alpha/beta fold hydrolase [unclassified Arthrobacter]|uniref:alpha/beta fold hydrolase n=1 Tax=unclassified Arthrobacter TaxID=235627 RepID=UPI002E0144AD|nr:MULTISPECIES: alpha/beta hydrolase [unclassified Arthrobacter]MEC5189738.1 sigma-B regulation protein RsbQ [Arthrobacter sp. MP_M4]MEC5204880.1 sigma-B regulation protein RsbQ [Arthrobacter sp. MP_M7]